MQLKTSIRRTAGAAALLALPFLAPTRASAACPGPVNPWFQPSTVEKGNAVLVTGTGVPEKAKLEFTFVDASVFPISQFRYLTKEAPDSCVVNQEYINTGLLKKGDYQVTARLVYSSGVGATTFNLGTLHIVKPATPIPLPTPVNCGQTAHTWWGPATTVNHLNPLFIAAVAYPNTQVSYWFEQYSGPVTLGTTYAVIKATAPNCTGQQTDIYLNPGTYRLWAGFVDEYGRYSYSSQGNLTVN